MKHIFRKKTLVILAAIYLIAISASIIIVILLNGKAKPVDATFSENISGWAWNNQLGWISFNSTDCDPNDDGIAENPPAGCPLLGETIPAYGVNIDSSGNFSGYAWSSNAGWISFNRFDTGNPPAPPYNGGSGAIAKYSLSTKQLTGWAKILHLNDGGWIKLRNEPPDTGPVYGVQIAADGQFDGWAWNGDSDGLGIGWTSFSCDTDGTCASNNYKVKARVPSTPVIGSVITPSGLDSCSSLQVNWNSDVRYQDSFSILRSENVLGPWTPAGGACSGTLVAGAVSCIDNTLSPGVTYYFTVSANNIFGSAVSTPVSGKTSSICQVPGGAGITARRECPNIVHLDWQIPVNDGGVDHYTLKRCNSTNNDCASNIYTDIAFGPCYNPITDNCDDNTISTTTQESVTSKYRYEVAGVNAGGEQGDWSSPSNEIRPCPRLPIWQETQ